MSHVDFLSRNPSINMLIKDSSWIIVEQNRDEVLKHIRESIANKEDHDKKYSIKNNILFIKIQDKNGRSSNKIIIPDSLALNLISEYHHNLLHAGWERTLHKIREQYWFKNMSKRVRKFCDNCLNCKVGKEASGKKQINLHPINKINNPFHTLHIDLIGNLTGTAQKSYAFVAIDAYTKFVIIHPLRDKTSKLIQKSLLEIIHLFGTPKRIISDREPAIMGKDIQDLFTFAGIEHHAVAKGVPRANGQIERLMRTIKDHLSAIAQTENRTWINKLGEVQLAINCTKSKATGYSPLELLIGKISAPPAINQLCVLDNYIDRDEIRKEAEIRMTEQSKNIKIGLTKNVQQ
ncbi:unnamed protein product [Colias eurytheme]|nr:unnamed protein product [Colias eurytheme]